jgi:thioredoxin-related protein
MKKLVLLILVISSLFAKANDPHWLNDFDQALELAQKENKDVYVFIGSDRCHFCDKFKDKTLSRKCVLKRIDRSFVPVYLSRDRHKVPSRFETQGVPIHYFLTNSGKLIYEARGAVNAEGLYQLLDEVKFLKD